MNRYRKYSIMTLLMGAMLCMSLTQVNAAVIGSKVMVLAKATKISVGAKQEQKMRISQNELRALLDKSSSVIYKMCSPTEYDSKYETLNYVPLDKEFSSRQKIDKRLGAYCTKDYINQLLKKISAKVKDRRLCIAQGDFGMTPDFKTLIIKSMSWKNGRLLIKYSVDYAGEAPVLQDITLARLNGHWKIFSWNGIL